MKKTNKLLSCLLALALMLTLVPALPLAASAATPTRTTVLNLTSSSVTYAGGVGSGNPSSHNIIDSTEGWKWYKTGGDGYVANTLVLDGLDLSVSLDTALTVPDGTKIVINSNNTIASTNIDGIRCEGMLTVSGNGSINITAGVDGIEADDGVTVESGEVTITAGYGIYSGGGSVTISGGTVNITADDTGIEVHSDVTINGGNIDIAAEDADGIYAFNNVTINGGSGTIRTNSNGPMYGAISAGDNYQDSGSITLGPGMSVLGKNGGDYSVASAIAEIEVDTLVYYKFFVAASDGTTILKDIRFAPKQTPPDPDPPPGGNGGGSSSAPATKPFTSSKNEPKEKVVDVFYMGLLGRDPDAGGFSFWMGQIDGGVMTYAQVAYHIIFSEEVKAQNLTNEQFLTRLYNGLFGRMPDEGGLEHWTGALSSGVISREAVFYAFSASPEFAARMDTLGLAV